MRVALGVVVAAVVLVALLGLATVGEGPFYLGLVAVVVVVVIGGVNRPAWRPAMHGALGGVAAFFALLIYAVSRW
jgi:hypothetical protein